MSKGVAARLLDTLELRAGSVITEQEIRALRVRWRTRFPPRKNEPDVGQEEVALCDALPMRVSDEQALRGLKYLRKLMLTKDGSPRNTKLALADGFGDEHAEVLHTLDHFLFMGFRWDGSGHIVRPYPIYRAVSHDGSFFEYIARPWQHGLPEFGPIGGVMS